MVPALHCDSEATWQHGNSLVNYMKMVEVEGLTGPVKFDQVQCWCRSGDHSLSTRAVNESSRNIVVPGEGPNIVHGTKRGLLPAL